MKIKELTEKSREIIKNVPEFDYSTALKKFKKEDIGIVFSTIKKGVEVPQVWCPNCGTATDRTGIIARSHTCSCGKSLFIGYGNNLSEITPYIARIVHVDSDFAMLECIYPVMATWVSKAESSSAPSEIWDSMEVSIPTEKTKSNFFIISKEFGLKKMASAKSSLAKVDRIIVNMPIIKDEKHDDYVCFMEAVCGKSPKGYGELLGEDLEAANKYTSSLSPKAPASAASAKKVKQSEMEDEIAKNLFRENAADCALEKAKGLFHAYRYSDKEYVYWCPDCGHYEVKECTDVEISNRQIVCTNCGRSIVLSSQPAASSRENFEYVDLVSNKEGNLAYNSYNVNIIFDKEKGKFIKKVSHSFKIVFFMKNDKIVAYGSSKNRLDYYGSLYNLKPIREREEELSVIRDSKWGKLGLDIIYKKADANPQKRYEDMLSFISTLKKVPVIEQLAKSGCLNLYDWIIKNNWDTNHCNPKATNVRECFNLTKTQAKLVMENDLTFNEMLHLKKLQSLDPTCTFEDYNWSYTTYRCNSEGTNDVSMAVEKTGEKVSTVIKYLSSCYYDQCIDWPEITSLWLDYIEMMDKLNFEPSEKKKEMFPSSLKKSHDILNFAVRNIFDKEKAEIFDENVAEAKRFEYSFEKYLIKAPDSAEDLVKEGIALNHSVGQHIAYVADGKEYILFIRAKSSPNTPLYTVELLKEEKAIVQVRGNSNRLIRDPEVLEFIQKWAKYKKLIVRSF